MTRFGIFFRSLLIRRGIGLSWGFDGRPVAEALGKAVKREIHNRGREQGQRLAEDQATDNRDAKWLAQFRSRASAQGQRQAAKHGGHGGHKDGAESQQARLINSVNGILAALAFRFERKVDHHNGVLLNNSYQQDDSYERNDTEIRTRNQQGEKRSDSRGRQRRKNRNGMDVALIEYAENDVHRHERGQNQDRLIREGGLKSLRRSLESGMDARW